MTEKEISEIKRTFVFERNAITTICGCYVNANREIISTFRQSVALMPEEELEKYLSLFKKTLSGTGEKNLIDIAFSNAQVENSDEHRLLMALRDSKLGDDETVSKFFARITENLNCSENYVILLTYNAYDVPFKAGDGRQIDADSDRIFSHILCSVCPVRLSKGSLSYDATEKVFHNRVPSPVIGSPLLGFLFPAFDGRTTNIYNALFYTSDIADSHDDFINAIFRTTPPMNAGTQNSTFRALIAEALEDDCNFRVAKNLHDRICDKIEEHKESHDDVPLALSKYEFREVLEDSGVPAEKLDTFTENYDQSFGAGKDLAPRNIVDPKKFELRTPDVVIKVSPGHSDLVETREIDGTKYILIRADEGVELNGLNISI